jgi:hypothetical protein
VQKVDLARKYQEENNDPFDTLCDDASRQEGGEINQQRGVCNLSEEESSDQMDVESGGESGEESEKESSEEESEEESSEKEPEEESSEEESEEESSEEAMAKAVAECKQGRAISRQSSEEGPQSSHWGNNESTSKIEAHDLFSSVFHVCF